MNGNGWFRKIHRWLSILFTIAVVVTSVSLAQATHPAWVSYLPLALLFLLLLTGLYLFALPHVQRWRGRGQPQSG